MLSKNPFVEEPQRAHWLTKYPSGDNYRVVWVKGKAAQVSGVEVTNGKSEFRSGSHRCPIYQFSHVAFVWMHERTVVIDLSRNHFVTADKLPIQVLITLNAKVRRSELALIAVATCFDESLEVLRTDVAAVVGSFCRSQQSESVLGAEKALTTELATHLGQAPSSSTFDVVSVMAQFRLPLIEAAAETEATISIGFEQERKKEERDAALSKLRVTRTFEELIARIDQEKRSLQAECAAKAQRATTDLELENARLDYLQRITALTQESETAIFHIDPKTYGDLELAKINSSMQQQDEAEARIVRLLKSLGEVTRNAASMTTVVGTNIPNTPSGV